MCECARLVHQFRRAARGRVFLMRMTSFRVAARTVSYITDSFVQAVTRDSTARNKIFPPYPLPPPPPIHGIATFPTRVIPVERMRSSELRGTFNGHFYVASK